MRPDAGAVVEEATGTGTVRDVRELILAATARVIRERGLGGATTKAIAEEARCAEGSIYRYFPDKHALFIECVKEGFPEFIQMVETLPKLAGKGSARHHLEELVKAALAFYRGILPMVAGAMAEHELLEQHRQFFKDTDRGPLKPLIAIQAYMEAYVGPEASVGSDERFARETVRVLMEGMRCREAKEEGRQLATR